MFILLASPDLKVDSSLSFLSDPHGRIAGNLEPDKPEDKNNSLPLSGLTASGAGGRGDGNGMTNTKVSHHEVHILDV